MRDMKIDRECYAREISRHIGFERVILRCIQLSDTRERYPDRLRVL